MDKDKKPFIPFVPTSAIVENGTGKTLEEILANLAVPIVNLTSIANDAVSAMMTKMEQYKDIGFSIIYTGANSTGVLFTYSSQATADALNKTWTFVSGFDTDGNAYNLHVTGYYNAETRAFTCSNVELVAGISNEVGNLESLETTDKSSVVDAINEVNNKTNIVADVYAPTHIPMTYTITNKVTKWPFELQEDGYYESTSGTNSYSICEIKFNNATDGKVIIDYIADHEVGADFAIFSNIDTTLSNNNSSDGNTGTTKVKLNTKYSPSPDVKQIVYDMPAGEHFIYIKYAKNHVTDEGADSLKFKIRNEYLEYATKEVSYGIKDYIDEKTGNLDALATESKDSLVDAINEIQPFTKNVIQVRTEEHVRLADLDPGLYYCPNMKKLAYYGGLSADMRGRMLLVSKDNYSGGKVGVMFAYNNIEIYHSRTYYSTNSISLSGIATKNDVLLKTQSTSFTPTIATHPVNKFYVDENLMDVVEQIPDTQELIDTGFNYATSYEEVPVKYTVSSISPTYWFELNEDDYYETTTAGLVGTKYAISRVTFNNDRDLTIPIQYINNGVECTSYMMFSNIDQELYKYWTDDGATGSTKVFKNCKGENTDRVKTLYYFVPAGEHYMDVKVNNSSSNSDFKQPNTAMFKIPDVVKIPTYENRHLATQEYIDNQLGDINAILATVTTPEVSE